MLQPPEAKAFYHVPSPPVSLLRRPGLAMPNRALQVLERALSLLLPAMDILDGRVHDARPPQWCAERGWADFLESITDEELHTAEAASLAVWLPTSTGAPQSLVDWAKEVATASRLPCIDVASVPIASASLQAVPERKRQQLSIMLGALDSMAAGAERIVDVGAGSGHFARLAAERFGRETVGIDKSRERIAAARARVQHCQINHLRYVAMDAHQGPLDFSASDLVVGLHACGDLGDLLVSRAAAAGSSTALVSCCLQKTRSHQRMPLSLAARSLVLAREVLGLANLTSQAHGVETDMRTTMLSRQRRHGLRRLLEARGLAVPPGAEMRGLNRRATRASFAEVAARACGARGLVPPSSVEVRHFEAESQALFGTIRRYSLPRNLLGRLVEVAVVCDRAAALAESGLAVRVLRLCEPGVTPRNAAIFASRYPERLPNALDDALDSV